MTTNINILSVIFTLVDYHKKKQRETINTTNNTAGKLMIHKTSSSSSSSSSDNNNGSAFGGRERTNLDNTGLSLSLKGLSSSLKIDITIYLFFNSKNNNKIKMFFSFC